jgi:hypothetical protein
VQIGVVPEKIEAMTKKELYAHPGWESCTFEGAEMSTLLMGLQTTFREKLEWLEEAETLALRFRANRKPAAGKMARAKRGRLLPVRARTRPGVPE